MKKQNLLILAISGVVIAMLLADHFGIFKVRELFSPAARTASVAPNNSQDGQKKSDSAAIANDKAGNNGPQTKLELGQDVIAQLISVITPDQKKGLLNDTAAFKNFVKQEASNLSLLQAANANNLQADPQTQLLIERATDNVLREIYLTKLINSKIPADYPNDQQVQEYFDKNKANLKVEESLAVWQIFLPVTEGMDDNTRASVAKEADSVAAEVKSGKIDFSAAAFKYSKHDASRLNGGFMGLIKVSELLPEIRKALDEMKSSEVSLAIKSAMGYHILKKGDVISSQELTLEQIRNEVKNLMLNQARIQLRNAINEEAAKQYPVTLDDATVEQWRQALLKTN